MKLLIATSNPAKLQDYKDIVQGLPIEAVGLKDIGIAEEFEEIHHTMEENAKGKAEFYQHLSGLPTLADDSGIEIPFYNMEPGVNTKHWDGQGKNDEQYIQFILDKIKAIPESKRQAQMRAVEAFSNGTETILAQGVLQGILTDELYTKSETHGYPWDLVFIIPEINKYYEELNFKENLKYNHRRLAFDKLKNKILQSSR